MGNNPEICFVIKATTPDDQILHAQTALPIPQQVFEDGIEQQRVDYVSPFFTPRAMSNEISTPRTLPG